jgi:hypothetical protein
MRILAALLVISLAACSSPGYYVRRADLAADPTPAVREADLEPVKLRGGSYRVTDEALLPDGRVTVRGPGRHGARWKSGLAVLLLGIPLQLAGSMIAIFGPPCDLIEGNPPASCRAVFGAGVTIGVIGHVMTFIVGPALLGAGAGQPPVEVP